MLPSSAATPQFVESATPPEDYSISVFESGAGVVVDALLTVREWERVVLLHDEEIVAEFAPGLYRLDRDTLADLAERLSWPDAFRGEIGATVVFVSTFRRHRRPWSVSRTDPGYRAAGLLDYRIADPRACLEALLRERVAVGPGAVDDLAARALTGALDGYVRRASTTPAQPPRTPRDLAEILTPTVARSLKESGIEEFRFSVTRLGDEPQGEARSDAAGDGE